MTKTIEAFGPYEDTPRLLQLAGYPKLRRRLYDYYKIAGVRRVTFREWEYSDDYKAIDSNRP